jgi:histidinol dehydrogenase
MKLIQKLFLNKKNEGIVFEDIKKKNNEIFLDETTKKVAEIIEQVKKKGDQALLELTHNLDNNNMKLSEIKVAQEEFEEAALSIETGMFDIIKQAIERIKNFHKNQIEKSWFTNQEEGIVLGQLVRPVNRVGIYVPGGGAEYPSSLIMGAIPALVAGVKEICIVTPLGSRLKISPYLLSVAQELGISEIYKIGGAQAIAALAYGTENVKPVDKIVGPGNIYVTLAKKQVFGQVDIDMLAGPSEILIWAEEGANIDYVVADLFSQAEHDEQATAVLVTTSEKLAEQVEKEINKQIVDCTRKDIIRNSLRKNGKIIVAEDQELVINLINEFAPEHLELQIEDPWSYLGEIKNFGAVFLGQYSPEPLGDYWAGPNHILPTMGNARQFSVLSVHDFLKRSSLIYCRRDKLLQDKNKIARFADLEGLTAHAKALRIRE